MAPEISHPFLANDSVIFTRATLEKASHLAFIIRQYEEAFGQMVNLNKSELSYSRNVPSPRQIML